MPDHIPELVIITGAGRGIGRSIALDLGSKGATVLCISRAENADATARHITEQGGSAQALHADLADYKSSGQRVRDWLEAHSFSRIGVVLAAGVLGPSGDLASTDLAGWDEAFRTNVLGNLAVAQAALPRMIAAGYGRLLFFAGGGAAYAYPLFPAYAMSKTALVRAVENLHEDLKGLGNIASVILAPGAVETDILASVREQGGYVKTTVDVQEPVNFAREFLCARQVPFSGRFVHVRDTWAGQLQGIQEAPGPDVWKLRRIEC